MRPILTLLTTLLLAGAASADPPTAAYLFPAGGRRGTALKVRVGGLYLYHRCRWEMLGQGTSTSRFLNRTPTRWFEGPLLPIPDSQRAEDYPQDMLGEVRIAPDAPLGPRRPRLWTSEGAAAGPVFVVGDLPEVIENESDGDAAPVPVQLPVTINGRIFPREDIDIWSFRAKKGQVITCEVYAARIGSPLDSRLVVRGPDGRRITENDDARGTDSLLQFTAPAEGAYQVHVSDSHGGGSQRHVYRLTITAAPFATSVYPLGGRRGGKTRFTLGGLGVPKEAIEAMLPAKAGTHELRFPVIGGPTAPVAIAVDDLPEYVEAEPNDLPAQAQRVSLGSIVNGRIDKAGDVDCWAFRAKKGEGIELALTARRLGSPLLAELEVCDAAGKTLTRSAQGEGDPTLLFTAASAGTYTVLVRDRFHGRGGPTFAYRLRLARAAPDFALELLTDAVSLTRGKSAQLRVRVTRRGGLAGAIALTVEGLPAGVKAAPLNAGQGVVQLTLTAGKEPAIDASRLKVRGTATIAGKAQTRMAANDLGEEEVRLGVGLPVPFKVTGTYDLRIAARGTVFRKSYKIDRGGHAGPFEVRLTDRQARHLQGVTGPALTIGKDKSAFDYPVTLPPWMETGRTSRTCVMLIGRIKDGGKEHTVSFTSHEQNDQVIAVVETGQLGLELISDTITARPGGSVRVPFKLARGKGLKGAVKVELIVPEHVKGVSAPAVEVAAGGKDGALVVKFAAKAGPFTAPLLLRATLVGKDGPVTAEATVEVAAEE